MPSPGARRSLAEAREAGEAAKAREAGEAAKAREAAKMGEMGEQRSRDVTASDGRRALGERIGAPDLGRHPVAGAVIHTTS
jgi:septal ring factor EnvC (AmiA/AmiB activator)